MSEEFKPCPFCGGKAVWCYGLDWEEEHDCHMIVCEKCGASFDLADEDNPETLEELREICANKWNTRKGKDDANQG